MSEETKQTESAPVDDKTIELSENDLEQVAGGAATNTTSKQKHKDADALRLPSL